MAKMAKRRVGRRLSNAWERARRARVAGPRAVEEPELHQEDVQMQEKAPEKKAPAMHVKKMRVKPKLGGRRVSPWTRAQAVAVAAPSSVQPPAVHEEGTEETLVPVAPMVQRETTTMSDFMGAMPLPKQREAHTATILVRLTPADKRALEKLARTAKAPLAVYCRAALQWIAHGGLT